MPLASRFSLRLSRDWRFPSMLVPLAVGDKDHPVGSGEDRPAGRVVLDLTGYRIELDGKPIATDPAEIERQQVKEEGSVRSRVQRIEPGPSLGVGALWMCWRQVVLPPSAGP